MPRTSPEEIVMTKKFQKQPPGDVLAFDVGGQWLKSFMSLSEIFVVMALCRRGPSTAAEVAREVSTWLDTPLPSGGLKRTLHVVAGLGWGCHSDGVYAVTSEGIAIMRGFLLAFMRWSGGNPNAPADALPQCFAETFERSR
jgi:hypothetical protein